MNENCLPSQLVYNDNPQGNFPNNWDVTNTGCNESTMTEYIHKIIMPYMRNKREKSCYYF